MSFYFCVRVLRLATPAVRPVAMHFQRLDMIIAQWHHETIYGSIPILLSELALTDPLDLSVLLRRVKKLTAFDEL